MSSILQTIGRPAMSSEPEPRIADWIERFELIRTDIQELLLRRLVFRRLREIVAANPELHRPSYLYEYLASTYAASSAAGVRRHMRHDDERRDGSLIGLLFAIRQSPELLTRARHVGLYTQEGMPADLAEREFDRLAEPRAPHLAARNVQQDIDRLNEVARPLERYATQRIAHLDRAEPSDIPNFDDLDAAFDTFRDVLRRYKLLLLAEGGDVVPVILEPWERVLTVPWIRRH